jgi:hypothetical protein
MDPVPYALLQYLSRAQKTDRCIMVRKCFQFTIIDILYHSLVELISRRERFVADFIADTIVGCAVILSSMQLCSHTKMLSENNENLTSIWLINKARMILNSGGELFNRVSIQ